MAFAVLPLGVDEPGRIDVDALLSLSEETLERQCTFSAFRTRGPGGQKRNKTASAAKLVHGPTGIVSQCNEFRSQAANRRRALHRLRFKIAAGHRTMHALWGDVQRMLDHISPSDAAGFLRHCGYTLQVE